MFAPSTKQVIITYEVSESRTSQISPKGLATEVSRAVDAGARVVHPRFSSNISSEVVLETLWQIRNKCPEVILELDFNLLPFEGEVQPLIYSLRNNRDLNDSLPQGVAIEFQVHSQQMLVELVALKKKGVLKGPLRLLLVPGIAGSEIARVRNLASMVSSLPPGTQWSVPVSFAAGGHSQSTLATLALLIGGHVRVDLENAAYFRKGELAGSHASSVARVASLSSELGRPLADADDALQILDLLPRRSLTLELLESFAESAAI